MNGLSLVRKRAGVVPAILAVALAADVVLGAGAPAAKKALQLSPGSPIVETAPCPAGARELLDVTGVPVGCEALGEAEKQPRRFVTLRGRDRFEVEPLLGTLVSAGGQSVLKYGDEVNLNARELKHRGFILYDNDGRLVATNDNHALNSVIAMAGDGHFAIVGPRKDRDNATRGYVTVYSPSGVEKFAVALSPGVMPTKLALRNGASAIAVAVTSLEQQKPGHNDVLVIKGDGALLSATPDFRYVNRLVFIGDDGDDLLVFARRSFSRINATTGQLIWRVPEFYRLAGPFAVALSADKQHLSIATAELEGQKDLQYLWRVHLLSMDSGLSLSRDDLSGLHPVRKARAIKWTSERVFTIQTTDTEAVKVQFD
jgi:hypothetical protein